MGVFMICRNFEEVLNTIKRLLLMFVITPCNKCRFYDTCKLRKYGSCRKEVAKVLTAIKEAKECLLNQSQTIS